MSLLAHLYTRIRGSQEDIATISLQYLLSQSQDLNRAFTKRISDLMQIELEDVLQYTCQVTGESDEKERPDMSGFNSSNDEVLLLEMKFYASLTMNQPLSYLDRIKINGGNGLLFICPTDRRTSLWYKLNLICEEDERDIKKVSQYCVEVDGVKLAIVTWTEIIELLKLVTDTRDLKFSSDVMQLEGYCKQLDSEAFIPFNEKDLSAEMAKRGERYYQVVDEVIELLCADKAIITSKKGVKATGYRKGYTRSLYLDNFTITLNYDRDLWMNSDCVETPFWIAIRDEEWDQPEQFMKIYDNIQDVYKQSNGWLTFLSLEPLQNATLDEVCDDLKNKILDYINLFR